MLSGDEHLDLDQADAADQVSAYLMLHFGKADARRLILGTAYAYKLEAEDPITKVTMTTFADEHGTSSAAFLQSALHRLWRRRGTVL